jgi:AraC-type DNA-binding domain-containing proteins
VSNCHQLKLESADGKIRLTEVAERSGFNDYSNFVRAFKNIGGVTPTQYIKIE